MFDEYVDDISCLLSHILLSHSVLETYDSHVYPKHGVNGESTEDLHNNRDNSDELGISFRVF